MWKAEMMCEADVWDPGAWRPRRCSKRGKVKHEGKLYCRVHDPERRSKKVEERDEKRRQEWDRKCRDGRITTAKLEIAQFVLNMAQIPGRGITAKEVQGLKAKVDKAAE